MFINEYTRNGWQFTVHCSLFAVRTRGARLACEAEAVGTRGTAGLRGRYQQGDEECRRSPRLLLRSYA
jgi:hypothetical protein